MEISDILKNYMQELKCTSKELSKASNISETIISRYRTGNRIPNQTNLDKIIEGLTKLSNKKYTKEEYDNNRISLYEYKEVKLLNPNSEKSDYPKYSGYEFPSVGLVSPGKINVASYGGVYEYPVSGQH